MGVSNQDGDGILNNQKLWYKQPAERWEDALPIGTGRLGAMIYGYPDHELMQLNEDSIWYGGPINRINPDAGKTYERSTKSDSGRAYFGSRRNFKI